MKKVQAYAFDHPNGYAHRHTEECMKKINDRRRGQGRIAYRYDILKRDGTGKTVVIQNITRGQLLAYMEMAKAQGSEIR